MWKIMILTTGAAGKTGRMVIQALAARGAAVRALVHRPEQTQTVEAIGALDVQVGDMCEQAVLDRAYSGVQAVYHICPNVSPDEELLGRAAINAAVAAGVEHFVYHSVLHPQTEDMPHHWHKLRVEEQIFKSGLPFTILQPTVYMQNILAHWEQILEQGIYPVPYSVETRLSMVDLYDVAFAAAEVLTQPGHEGAIYELVGTQAMTQTEVAAILSQQLERSVRAQSVSLEAWERSARSSGMGDYQVKTLVKMFRYYDSYGLWGSPRVLGWLLDRTPTDFSAFVKRIGSARQDELLP